MKEPELKTATVFIEDEKEHEIIEYMMEESEEIKDVITQRLKDYKKEGIMEKAINIYSSRDNVNVDLGYAKVRIVQEKNKIIVTAYKVNVESEQFEPVFSYTIDA